MEYNTDGVGKPFRHSIGSKPGTEDHSSPALRVPDGDSLPGELAERAIVKLNEHEADLTLANLKTRLES